MMMQPLALDHLKLESASRLSSSAKMSWPYQVGDPTRLAAGSCADDYRVNDDSLRLDPIG